jgi:hypothetical protein
MVQQLPLSLERLVEQVEVLASQEEISLCLQRQQQIYLASDGGAIPGRASYGWIIQIGKTKTAKGKGPGLGDNPCLFQAEGYGMASALVYLQLVQ